MRRIMIAGTESGAGKTTITLAIMAALIKKGWKVQGFKCGPDYIDPAFHTEVTGRPSRNLDSWMLNKSTLLDVFHHGMQGADIAVIEGVMGLFDGKNPFNNEGSTAEISSLTKTPVLLCLDCWAMGRSAAAVVKGFQSFDSTVKIGGVIVNKAAGEGHYQMIKTAVEKECGLPVIGYFPNDLELSMPERHLGLVQAAENQDLAALFNKLAEQALKTINLDLLFEISQKGNFPAEKSIFTCKKEPLAAIAVARDKAFSFYYEENLELLEACGAKILPFSPLEGEKVPSGAAGIYLGGGYPEIFANELSNAKETIASIKQAYEKGMPILAECGGFMYLTEELETAEGQVYKMAGLIPGRAKMEKQLQALGYLEAAGLEGSTLLPEGMAIRGHVYHHSQYEGPSKKAAYKIKESPAGFTQKNLMAGYAHFHFASNPEFPQNFVGLCLKAAGKEV
ncbi:cobyrinate a,c-diamide synthase [Metabacillus sp. GX 13764]|uniref:cobyrinate a,c-diamide synthase n=1 Tax=Metabacillus kandeliae TaxID=2900151 RepID=UPI001E2FCE14|nr:cobyrinate a,c-diamide synthase [Metabacillus kandeliae]MCD7035841.1 cobyrinate a,c-diamide synthase [Metabacillus kandeliae]